jgi:hypothetical protein
MKLTGTTHIRTTAYHPASNGLVERFHRQLKAAIKCHETEGWTEVLPIVLLGIRTAWKEELNATPAEYVFGESIKLPGQFLEESETLEDKNDDIIEKIKQIIKKLRPKSKKHGEKSTFIFKDMKTTPQVFVRHGPALGTLQQPYDGPYKVLSRGLKTFKIKINGKAVNISIDRLKPAYLLKEDNIQTKSEETAKKEEVKTKTGRISRPVVRFKIN